MLVVETVARIRREYFVNKKSIKHADRDHGESLEFSETENDAIIRIAILECGLLLKRKKQKLSIHNVIPAVTLPSL